MISAINSSQPSFTSVIPVRVFIDGVQTTNEKLIKSSCRQLATVLAGPAKSDKSAAIMRKYAKCDKDYRLDLGINGYPKAFNHKNLQPSSYFRNISTEDGRTFFVTGAQAKRLNEFGKAIGQEKKVCNTRQISDSFDLMVAKQNYGNLILDMISDAKSRIFAIVNEKYTPLTLNLGMKSNGKYGLTTFKMNLDDIAFTIP